MEIPGNSDPWLQTGRQVHIICYFMPSEGRNKSIDLFYHGKSHYHLHLLPTPPGDPKWTTNDKMQVLRQLPVWRDCRDDTGTGTKTQIKVSGECLEGNQVRQQTEEGVSGWWGVLLPMGGVSGKADKCSDHGYAWVRWYGDIWLRPEERGCFFDSKGHPNLCNSRLAESRAPLVLTSKAELIINQETSGHFFTSIFPSPATPSFLCKAKFKAPETKTLNCLCVHEAISVAHRRWQ